MTKIIRFESSYEDPYPLEIRGEAAYRRSFESIFPYADEDGVKEDALTARLIFEDTNVNDANAVRVEIDGHIVGYLSKPAAKKYRAKLAELALDDVIGECTASVRGGYRNKRTDELAEFGVKLDINLENLAAESESTPVISISKPLVISPPVSIPKQQEFPKMNIPQATTPVKKKWTRNQIIIGGIGAVLGCGCLGFWGLWVLAKLSGY